MQNICEPDLMQTKIIAHRGAWKKARLPQNSIAALRQAIEIGCDGSECDVWLTSDNVVVVNHDPDFCGVKIETSTYRQLLEVRLPNGEAIPTLEQYLSIMLESRLVRLVVEIKPSKISKLRSLQAAEATVAQVREIGAESCVDYISFDGAVLHKILALDALAHVSYLGGDQTPAQLQDAGFTGADYHYLVLRAHPDWIPQLRMRGLTLNAWTVNLAQTMRWLLDEGADFITTDEPEILQEIMQLRSST
jgi:glycerophosphoryl diester phosphodiesterase